MAMLRFIEVSILLSAAVFTVLFLFPWVVDFIILKSKSEKLKMIAACGLFSLAVLGCIHRYPTFCGLVAAVAIGQRIGLLPMCIGMICSTLLMSDFIGGPISANASNSILLLIAAANISLKLIPYLDGLLKNSLIPYLDGLLKNSWFGRARGLAAAGSPGDEDSVRSYVRFLAYLEVKFWNFYNRIVRGPTAPAPTAPAPAVPAPAVPAPVPGEASRPIWHKIMIYLGKLEVRLGRISAPVPGEASRPIWHIFMIYLGKVLGRIFKRPPAVPAQTETEQMRPDL